MAYYLFLSGLGDDKRRIAFLYICNQEMSNKSHEVNCNLIDRQYKNINMITLMTSMITTTRRMHQIRTQDVPTTFCISAMI